MKELKRAIIQRKIEFLKSREQLDKKIQNKTIGLIKDNLTYCYQSLKGNPEITGVTTLLLVQFE